MPRIEGFIALGLFVFSLIGTPIFVQKVFSDSTKKKALEASERYIEWFIGYFSSWGMMFFMGALSVWAIWESVPGTSLLALSIIAITCSLPFALTVYAKLVWIGAGGNEQSEDSVTEGDGKIRLKVFTGDLLRGLGTITIASLIAILLMSTVGVLWGIEVTQLRMFVAALWVVFLLEVLPRWVKAVIIWRGNINTQT